MTVEEISQAHASTETGISTMSEQPFYHPLDIRKGRPGHTDVKRIMVDDGSGACIIRPRVLSQMRLEDKIVPCCITPTGIPKDVTTYKLNVDPLYPPVRQVRRKFNVAINEAVSKEVDKLLTNGSIRESKYPRWVANVVMVKKKNGKWQMARVLEFLGRLLRLQPNPHGGRGPGEDYFHHPSRNILLSSHSIWIKERGGDLSKIGDQNVQGPTRQNYRSLHKRHVGQIEKEGGSHRPPERSLRNTKAIRYEAEPEKCAFDVTSSKLLGLLVSQRGIEVNPDQIKSIEGISEVLTIKKQVQKLVGRIATLSRFNSRSSDRCRKLFNMIKKDNRLQWNAECIQALRELNAYLSSPPLLAKVEPGEHLLIYLAVSEVMVSAVLVREDKDTQSPIYYFSKTLIDAETIYPHLEKLALALVVASRKLRPYFQWHPISVVLANFIADFSTKIIAKVEKEISHTSYGISGLWVLYTDSASNASGSGLGLVLEVPIAEVIRQSIWCPDMTNNEAEYEAVIAGLKLALKYRA
uniref:Uncharacterized protein LOC104214401 n=1 Tax=Nicotiana sylvestris TaxID=4096 RepID=A0A1U7V297_NICSY|nr:PREDICTED: uncharacterized protein LOC104214401 [Nicotiana sylvestris]